MTKVEMSGSSPATPAGQQCDSHGVKEGGGASFAPAPRGIGSQFKARPFLDVAALMRHVEGDRDLLQEIVRLFADTSPGMMAKLRHGVETNQPAKVCDAAHAIRGAARNFFAPSVESAARALEAMGSEGRLTGAQAALGALEREMASLHQALAALVQEQQR